MNDRPTLASCAFSAPRALEFAKACVLAKEDGETIVREMINQRGYGNAKFVDSEQGPEAYIGANDSELLVVFRGTDRFKETQSDHNLPSMLKDWSKNLDYKPTLGPFGGYVHHGLFRVLIHSDGSPTEFWRKIRTIAGEYLESGRREIWLTGCSQGAVMASFAASMLTLEEMDVAGLYTFGSPCPGDERFAQGLEASLPCFFRVVHENDLFAKLPPSFLKFGPNIRYAPAGRLIYLKGNAIVTSEDPWKRFSERARRLASDVRGVFRSGDSEETMRELAQSFSHGLRDHYIESYVDALEHQISV